MRAFLLPHLLEQAAARRPERTAVMDERGPVSYGDLNQRTTRLANLLRDQGVRPGDRVGLFLKKSADAVAGIYGILKAGAVYVPLDPFAPAARLGYIGRDCGIRCLISGREQASTWEEIARAGAPLERVVVVDADDNDLPHAASGIARVTNAAVNAAADRRLSIPTISQDLAYILYTSGSTGQPKGVMLSHLNALVFVEWCRDYFGATESDVFSNHAPLHFDLTIFDLYVAAMAGAAMAVVPADASVFPAQLAALIVRHGITVWYSVPSALVLLAQRGNVAVGGLPSLRHVVFAGEVFPTKHLRRLTGLLPHAQFTNLYGPTETNVCTYYRVPPLPADQTDPIPIGRAIDNVEVFAVDEAGRRAASGQVGELYVRGATVAAGYWNDPDRTAAAFVDDPEGRAGPRAYRTGDLVRETPEGDFLFLGRRDHQIKSRGYRIEIGDIEAALHAHAQVADCAVIAVPDDVLGNRLKAFVVLQGGGPTDVELARFCATLLPRYMVPESFTLVDALPHTSTGKLDRTRLASLGVDRAAGTRAGAER